MLSGIYKLKSAARPAQYLSLVDGKIVGHADEPGVVNEWFVSFDEIYSGKFQPVRNGEVCDEYIYFNDVTGSLVMSGKETVFPVQESPRAPNLFFIAINGTNLVWALLAWNENTPVVTQVNAGSTEQLWVFEKCVA